MLALATTTTTACAAAAARGGGGADSAGNGGDVSPIHPVDDCDNSGAVATTRVSAVAACGNACRKHTQPTTSAGCGAGDDSALSLSLSFFDALIRFVPATAAEEEEAGQSFWRGIRMRKKPGQ